MSNQECRSTDDRVSTLLNTSARRVLLGICLLNGITAPLFGILMMVFPNGEFLHMQEIVIQMQTWPGATIFFRDLFWSGFALLCVNGLPNVLCLILWRLRRQRAHTVLGIFCGVLLILWCTWEMIFIPNMVSVSYLMMGITQAVAALYCRYNVHEA